MIPLFEKIRKEGPKLTKRHANYLNKIQAKTIVAAASPTVKVAKLIKTFTDPKDFVASDLNPLHILKASRGSGYCLDLSGATVLTVQKTLKAWKLSLSNKKLPIEFLIETKIDDAVYGVTGTAVDYKFFCFHGKPAYFLCRDGKNRNFYDLDYKPLKMESDTELDHIDLAPMIRIAEELSAPFQFVRIDLYNCKDGVYFGEYTFNCREGKQEFPMELELYFGSLWKDI
jgi:hypothetical protein